MKTYPEACPEVNDFRNICTVNYCYVIHDQGISTLNLKVALIIKLDLDNSTNYFLSMFNDNILKHPALDSHRSNNKKSSIRM